MFFMEKTVIRTNIGIQMDAASGIARIYSVALVPHDWSRLFCGLVLLILSGVFAPAEAQNQHLLGGQSDIRGR